MDDLSIRKNRATVTAIFSDGTKSRGEVFLASYSETHYGHQKVADILEGEKVFIPVSIREEDRVEFINKDLIMIMEGELSSAEDEEKLGWGHAFGGSEREIKTFGLSEPSRQVH